MRFLVPVAMSSMLALAAALLVGCDDDTPNIAYSPDKATFDATAQNYAAQPVVETADAIQATGRATNVTDRVQADSLALRDATLLVVRNALVPALSTKNQLAGKFFTENPSLAFETVERALEAPREPIYAATQIGPDRGYVYELYRVFFMSAAKRIEVLDRLADLYRQLAELAVPTDVEFSVLLSDLQRVSYQDRVKMVINAVQSKIDELGYAGTVVALDADSKINPEELNRRKRDLVVQIPDGANVEISLTLGLTSQSKIKQIALYSTRRRKMAPLAITDHPDPVGGRYQYSVSIASHYIKKGSTTVRLEVTDANGVYEQDYELAGHFQYSTGNIGLLMIRGFKGHLQNLTHRLKEAIRLPDEEGKPTVMLDFTDTRVGLTGQVGTSLGGATRAYNYRIGVFRPSTTTVWVLTSESAPDAGVFSDANRVGSLPWQVVWQEDDPDNKFGELNDIQVPAKSTKLVIRVAYNGGKDYDILLFDFEGKDAKAVLRQADTLYSTRNRQ